MRRRLQRTYTAQVSHAPAPELSLLRYAQEKLGPREVARRLQVSEEMINGWLAAPHDMPNRKRLALADLIQELTYPGIKK